MKRRINWRAIVDRHKRKTEETWQDPEALNAFKKIEVVDKLVDLFMETRRKLDKNSGDIAAGKACLGILKTVREMYIAWYRDQYPAIKLLDV